MVERFNGRIEDVLQSHCGFRKFPDTDFINSWTRVSVKPGQ
jgi:hypothetical protein